MTATDWEPVAIDGPAWEGPSGWPSDAWFADQEWGDDHPDDLLVGGIGDDR